MQIHLFPAILVALFAVLSLDADASGDDKPKLKRVAEITDVKYELQTSEPPNLIVTASGNVPSGGWTDVQLLRREYVKPPADGIWEYDLVARPPEGPSTQAITTVKATDAWEKVDISRLKGLRVYGLGKGAKTIKFGE